MEVRNKDKYEKQNFCSRKCQGEYSSRVRVGKNSTHYVNGNRTKVQVTCNNCGKTIAKEKQFIDKFEKSFCDRKCQIEYYRNHTDQVSGKNSPRWSKVTKNCEWCDKEYETYLCLENETRFCSKECRNNWQSEMMKGENHYNWRGGTTSERASDMISREYKEWRKEVFERDEYTCQNCGDKKGGNLRAHHLAGWSKNPDLRHEVSNGITLCDDCHKLEHSKKQDIQSELPK